MNYVFPFFQYVREQSFVRISAPLQCGIFVMLLLTSMLMTTVVHAEDPHTNLREELKSLYDAQKEKGAVVNFPGIISKGEDIFAAAYTQQSITISDDYRVIDMIFDHLTKTFEYCPVERGFAVLDTDEKAYDRYRLDKDAREPIVFSPNDVANIYALTPRGQNVLTYLESKGVLDRNLVTEIDASFQESCEWVVACAQGMTPVPDTTRQAEFPEQRAISGYSDEINKECLSIVQELYEHYDLQYEQAERVFSPQGLDFYYNVQTGTENEKEKSLHVDLGERLNDIGWKVALKEGVSPFSRYDVQTVTDLEIEDYPAEYVSVPENTVLEEGEGGVMANINAYVPTINVPESAASREKTADYAPRDREAAADLGKRKKDIIARAAPLPKTGPLSSLVSDSQSMYHENLGNAVIQPNLCEEPIQEEAEDPYVDLVAEGVRVREQVNKYADELDAAGEGIYLGLAPEGSLTDEEEETFDTTERELPLLSPGDILADLEDFLDRYADISEMNETEAEEEVLGEFAECMERYTDEDPGTIFAQLKKHLTTTPSVMICLREIMCDEFTDPSGLGLYRVRMCAIPESSIKSSNIMRVPSLFSSIQAVGTVTESMRRSGRLIRHIKSKEFFEFQTFGLKLNKQFSFSIKTLFKDPEETSDPKAVKKNYVKEQKTLAKHILKEVEDIHDNAGFLHAPYLYNENLEKASKKTAQDLDQIQKNIIKAEEYLAEYSSNTNSIAEFYDVYYRDLSSTKINKMKKFIDQYIAFQKEKNDQLEELKEMVETHYEKMK